MAVTGNYIFMRFDTPSELSVRPSRSNEPSPRQLDQSRIRQEARPYLSAQNHAWFYHAGQGSMVPLLANPDLGFSPQPEVREPQYARPLVFSGLGQPDHLLASARRAANSHRPHSVAPKHPWAVDLKPLRKSQLPTTEAERKLPCWSDCPPPPGKRPPPMRRDPINGVPCDESKRFAFPSVTTAMDYRLSPRQVERDIGEPVSRGDHVGYPILTRVAR